MPTLDPPPDFAAQAAERLDDEQQMQQVLSLLGKLPQRERDVFALCAWMEVSYEDAAVALAIPVGTVRSRLSRARTRLHAHTQDSNAFAYLQVEHTIWSNLAHRVV